MKRSNPMLAAVLLLAAMPVCAAAAPPQGAAPVDSTRPQAVIDASAECSRRQDWRCLAGLMDPAALTDLRGLLGELVEGTGTANPRLLALFGGQTPEQIRRLDDAGFFAAFMSGTMKNLGGISIDSVQVVGAIPEGDDQYHAVTRTVMRSGLSDTPVTTMDIASLRRIDGRWRLQLKADVKAMTDGLRRMRADRGAAASGQGATPSSTDARRPQPEALKQRRLEAVRQAQDAARPAQGEDTETERDSARD
ncbi:hypothetical protein LVB77_13495 [Lysobacter sp. 5GHs7-4]|uniref:hypothetical protein n=1 Tax=Lysobacter sp. 5GHs7-4 TaxID=2904253 RepID=UPI001E2856B2|nr:hypothetical protein [Lysobacter sp. 5GHs7-4]UHQ21688.1 hypothetical protein LVB77_13495 [Lysobacter sp. 5GHs7-4]